MAGRLSPPRHRGNVVKALFLAIAQLDDPACVGVLVRSVLLSLLAYGVLLAVGIWGTHALLLMAHWPAWLAALLGTIGVVLLAFWLFLPTVMVIATLYMERIVRAVEARHYPYLTCPHPGRADGAGLGRAGPGGSGPVAECRGPAAGAAHPGDRASCWPSWSAAGPSGAACSLRSPCSAWGAPRQQDLYTAPPDCRVGARHAAGGRRHDSRPEPASTRGRHRSHGPRAEPQLSTRP